MEIKVMFVFTLVFVLPIQGSNTKDIEWKSLEISSTNLTKSFTDIDISLPMCAAVCLTRDDCSAFLFAVIDRQCTGFTTQYGATVTQINNNDIFYLQANLDCGVPPAITNAIVEPGGSTFQSIRQYTCDTGYLYSNNGSTQAHRGADIKWTVPTMICKDCGVAPNVTNAAVGAGNTTIGSTLEYTCKTGSLYINNGTTQAVCGADTIWTVPTMICKDCGVPPNVTNAAAGAGNTTIGSTIEYTCNSGYVNINNGTTQAVCGADTIWTVPTLLCKDCGVPPNVTNATVGAGSTTIGSTRQYLCKPGYGHDNSGTTQAVCGNDTAWTEPTMLCEALPCPSWYMYVPSIPFCYKYHGDYKTQANAEAQCYVESGGTLVTVDTEPKFQELKTCLSAYPTQLCFISAVRTSATTWAWGNGETCNTELHRNPQYSIRSYHNCLAQQGHLWYSRSCTDNRNYICEVPMYI